MERTKPTVSPNPTGRTLTCYPYDGSSIARLQDTLSAERLSTYLRLASGDRERAMRIYTQNVALGSALYGPLQVLEVALRNAVNDVLSERYGGSWYNEPRLLKRVESEAARRATEKVQKKLTTGRVVAELNFGFWVALFARGYDATLWRTHLHDLFTPKPNRRNLHGQLNRLRSLRNRVAHHEPILQRDLRTDYEKIIWILGMLSPDAASWTEHHSRVLEVLAMNYDHISRF